MPTNIFYRIAGARTKIATFPVNEVTQSELRLFLELNERLPPDSYTLSHGCCLKESGTFTNDATVTISFKLHGGKGGFGSRLRAIGAQIEKTTNRDACRDLSGRRLRDVKREKDAKKLLSLQRQLKQEKIRKKREKIERLKKYIDKVESAGPSNQLSETQPKRIVMDEACEQGLINNAVEETSSSSSQLYKPFPVPDMAPIFNQTESAATKKKAPDINLKSNKQLWLGVDFDDEDDDIGDDSHPESDQINKKA